MTTRKSLSEARVITAIRTPYSRPGAVDVDAFDRLVQHQIDAGVNGLVIGDTTGDGHLLEWDQHLALIAHAVQQFGRELLIVGNTGSNVTAQAIRHTELGFLAGMDAALHVPPYY